MPGGGNSTFGGFTLGNSYDAGNGFCFTLNSFASGFTSGNSLIVSSTPTTLGLSSSKPTPGFTGNNSFSYTFSRFSPDPSNLVIQEYTGTVASSAPPVNKGAFLVSAGLKAGVISGVTITSEKGRDCTIQNPWPGKKIQIIRNSKKKETVEGDRFTLKTKAGETLELKAE